MMDETTSQACLRAAFQAILRGDTAERDRLCQRGGSLEEAEAKAAAVERVLGVDFYVTTSAIVIPTVLMAKGVGIIQ